MIRYALFYDGLQIGILEILDGKHRYTPDLGAVETLRSRVPLSSEMLVQSDWRRPIFFFQERLQNAARFGIYDNIGYQTDLFRLKRLPEQE